MTVRILLTAACVLLAGGGARADFITVNRNEHSDVELTFENGILGVGVGFDDRLPPLRADYATNEVLHFAALGTPGFRRTLVPSQSFLGPAGATAYVFPQAQNPNLPFIGIAAGEDEPEAFDGFDSPLTLTFTGVRGPGQFALWQNSDDGPVVFASTLTGANSVPVPVGGHTHYNWGFTAPGLYELDVVASGRFNGTLLTSETATLYFGVGAVQAVPLPPSAAIWLVGGLMLAAGRRLSRRPA